jgi:hypothetical protein
MRKWPAFEYSGGPEEKRDHWRGLRCRVIAFAPKNAGGPNNRLIEFYGGLKAVVLEFAARKVRR